MGNVKKKLEEREHQRAKEHRIVKHHINTMEKCLEEAKEQKLPTVDFLESSLAILKYLLKGKTGYEY